MKNVSKAAIKNRFVAKIDLNSHLNPYRSLFIRILSSFVVVRQIKFFTTVRILWLGLTTILIKYSIILSLIKPIWNYSEKLNKPVVRSNWPSSYKRPSLRITTQSKPQTLDRGTKVKSSQQASMAYKGFKQLVTLKLNIRPVQINTSTVITSL